MRLGPPRPQEGAGYASRTTLPGNQQAAGAARRFLRAALADWSTRGARCEALSGERVLEDGALLISELVTNAVIHAGTAVDVVCRLDTVEAPPGLVIEVGDLHPSRVLRGDGRPPDDNREGGRGLHLVAALSDAWGISYRRDRKTVWCRIDLAAEPTEAGAGAPLPAPRGEPVAERAGAAPASGGLTGAADVPGFKEAVGAGEFPGPPPGAELLAPALVRASRRADADWIDRGSLSFLAEASDLLAGQLDEDNVASLTTQLLVPRLADWCAVWLYPAGAAPRLSQVWHRAEHLTDGLRAALEKVPPPPAGALPGARSWPWPDLSGSPSGSDGISPPGPDGGPPSGLGSPSPSRSDGGLPSGPDPRAAHCPAGAGSALAVPLATAGRCYGTLLLGRAGPGALSDEVNGLVEDLARRVALAVGAARRYARQALISTVLQRGLLPPAAGRIPGVEHFVVYEPMGGDWVGGDFYDLFPAGDGRWCFALGDVCGSGPEAASLTGIARPVLRLLAREGCGVSDVLDRLNKALADEAATALLAETAAWEGGQARFLSLLYGEIVPYASGRGARCTLASAGHPLPLHLASDGEVLAAATPQMLLGISDTAHYRSESFDLYPGDTLLCVTDGVTERRRGPRQFDDDNGLATVLAGCRGLSAAGVAERVRRAVHDFDEVPPADDLAMLVLQAR